MCLLIAKPAGVSVPKEHMKNGWRENPHGGGFAFLKDGKIVVRKGFRRFKDMWRSYRDFQEYTAIIHFRWGNVGSLGMDNCHPFIVDSDLVFAHNGTISITSTDKVNHADWSDTRVFNELILKELRKTDHNFLENTSWKWMISQSIGYSKLVFLDKEGKLTIINKGLGELEKDTGIWYSNADYKKEPTKIATITKVTQEELNGFPQIC
jgi:predicted glutamine amidotransferase